jgi:hypothetical protein
MNIDHLVQQQHWTDRQHVLGGLVSITGMLVASSVSQSVCLLVLATAAPAPANSRTFFQTSTKLWTALQQSTRKEKCKS